MVLDCDLRRLEKRKRRHVIANEVVSCELGDRFHDGSAKVFGAKGVVVLEMFSYPGKTEFAMFLPFPGLSFDDAA